MGILASVLRRPNAPRRVTDKPYATATEYSPAFTSFSGGLYEQQLTRACIERIALGCSKLKPEIVGNSKPRITRAIKTTPNSFMTWPTFLARTATLLETDTTAYVVPSYDENMNVNGLWPLKPESCDLVDRNGIPWMVFHLFTGEEASIPLSEVCVLTRFQYLSDVFGGGNDAIKSTLKLMDRNEQAQTAAMRSGATIRFIGKLNGTSRPEDIEKSRKKFSEDNLSSANGSGLMVYDDKWASIQQVEPKSYTIPADEMARIDKNVYTYFGINEKILTNDFTEEQWGAFYESVIEPIAIQLGEGLTRMLYTQRERAAGNKIMFSSNRLEYASNASKRNMMRDMGDRGVLKVDDMRAIMQLPPLPDGAGQVYTMRGEYYVLDDHYNVIHKSGGDLPGGMAPSKNTDARETDPGGDDDIYNDNDSHGKGDIEQGK